MASNLISGVVASFQPSDRDTAAPSPLASPAVDRTGSPSPIRLLMLHGWTQNATVLRSRCHAFVRKFKGVADLVFINAPHLVAPEDCGGEREDPRAWWSYVDDDATAGDTSDPNARFRRRTVGWEESRAAIARCWTEDGPFDGLVGFSQGAVVIHRLLLDLHAATAGTASLPDECASLVSRPPRVAVLICGFPARGADGEVPRVHTPSLHSIAENDATVPVALQRDLAAAFDGPVEVLLTDKGHAMPQRAGDMARIVQFVKQWVA